jgi:hypothetical protein
MKALLIASLFLLVGCFGGGKGSGSSSSSDDGDHYTDYQEFLVLTFADPANDHTGSTLFHFDGFDTSKPQAQMLDYDLQREIEVPSFVEVLANPHGQIPQGMVAKLSITGNLTCYYNFNISLFEFDYCMGTYGNLNAGDKFKLEDLLDVVVTNANIDIEFDSNVTVNQGGIQLRANF